MSQAGFFWLIVGLGIVGSIIFGVVRASNEAKILSSGTDAERRAVVAKQAQRAAKTASRAHGDVRPQVVCPHCQQRGNVRCQAIKNKKGISGGKATGALLTGGVSMLATGLSRKEAATQAYCSNCQSTWQF